MKTKIINSILLVLAMIVLFSCKKEIDPRYQPKGEYAKIEKQIVQVTPEAWILSSGQYHTGNYWCYNITSDVINGGYVMVYYVDGNNWHYALPWGIVTCAYNSGYVSFNSSGNCTLIHNSSNFEIVTVTQSMVASNPNTNWNKYSEVSKLIEAQN